jgi:glycosyltransferase involved in cell wall biosynthesis
MPPAKPVRILIVHPRDIAEPTGGGIQTFLHDFIKFSPADFEIVVAGVTRDVRRRPIGRMQFHAIDGRGAWQMPLAPAQGLPRNPIRLAQMIGAQLRLRASMLRGGRLLQIHRPYRSILLLGHRGPRVQFIHLDVSEPGSPADWPRLHQLYRGVAHSSLARMDRIFVVSEAGAARLREMYPAISARISFLPVWFDERIFHPAAPQQRDSERAAVLETLSINAASGDKLVLFAGRLDANKDPLAALEGFASYAARPGVSAQLVVCGEGELHDALTERARELGVADRVHIVGDQSRERLAALMRSSDALLVTSKLEGGGPRVVVEALACGLPVVAPSVGEVPRRVQHQRNGYLLAATGAAEICTALEWTLSRDRAEFATAAIEAVEPFTAKAALQPLYEAYREMVRGRP